MKNQFIIFLLIGTMFFSCNDEKQPQHKEAIIEVEKAPKIHELNRGEIPSGDKVIAIVGALLIDGNGGEPTPNSCIIIVNDKIEMVGRAEDISIPEGAEVVDGQGMSLLPGLIDAHYHNEYNTEMAPLFLKNGITSVRDPGAWIEFYDPVRATGQRIPRLFLTGPHIDMYPPAYPDDSFLVNDAEEGRLAVEKFFEQGATAIKVYLGLSIGIIRAVCETAHENGIPVTAHLETANAIDAINAGLDGIEHITSFGRALLPLQESEKYKQLILGDVNARRRGRYEVWNALDLESERADFLIQFLADKKTFVSPTLAIFEKRPDKGDAVEVNGFENMVKLAGKINESGGRIVVGSHTWVPYAENGFAYFRELELLGKAGMSNAEIIIAATMENARFFRIEERLGSIEAGKTADIILVKGNPLKQISDMRNVNRVMLNGVWVR